MGGQQENRYLCLGESGEIQDGVFLPPNLRLELPPRSSVHRHLPGSQRRQGLRPRPKDEVPPPPRHLPHHPHPHRHPLRILLLRLGPSPHEGSSSGQALQRPPHLQLLSDPPLLH